MKKLALAAALAVVAVPAIAGDLTCNGSWDFINNRSNGTNDTIRVTFNNQGDMTVGHLINGQLYDRAAQYNAQVFNARGIAELRKKNPDTVAEWKGTHKTKPWLTMFGAVYYNANTGWRYGEWNFDSRANAQTVNVVVNCRPTQTPDTTTATLPPVAAPAPMAPAPAPAPSAPADKLNAPMTFTAVKLKDCDNCDGLLAYGTIVPGSLNALKAVIAQENQAGKTIQVVGFTSPGGNLSEGLDIGRYIRDRKLDTMVHGGCASACSYAFLGGVNRLAAINSIGLHQFSSEGGPGSASGAQSIVSLLLSYVKDMGVTADFITVAEETKPNDVHWLSSVEMKAMGVAAVEN